MEPGVLNFWNMLWQKNKHSVAALTLMVTYLLCSNTSNESRS